MLDGVRPPCTDYHCPIAVARNREGTNGVSTSQGAAANDMPNSPGKSGIPNAGLDLDDTACEGDSWSDG